MTPDRGRVVSRRAVLGAFGGFAAAAVASSALVWGRGCSSSDKTALEVPDDAEGIARIGYGYLLLTPDEADRAKLREFLSDAGGPRLTGAVNELSSVRSLARADAASGNVVLVDGWVLPVSEARAAALVALAADETSTTSPA
jgi:hypothetical protein